MRQFRICLGTQGDAMTSLLELLRGGSCVGEIGGQVALSGPSFVSGIAGILSGRRRVSWSKRGCPRKGAAPQRGAWRRSRPLSRGWTVTAVSDLAIS